ncbi:MAG TPA: DinB family protein [Nocardioidaceae bacterium]|nr:DinB family protein [Nocardioidaceae bacterium]
MPAHVSPHPGEKDQLIAYVAQQIDAFRTLAFGLTDEQARLTPTPSTLSIGGLVKHATGVLRGWTARVTAAPNSPAPDGRSGQERMAEHLAEFALADDESLASALDRFDAQSAQTLRDLESADLDAAVPVPRDAPWFPKDVDAWSVRWVALHLVEELARHAGHGDIIREAIDGATMYELVGGREGWPETEWLKPWRPADAK